MAAIVFPSSPSVGTVFFENGVGYKWDGVAWVVYKPTTTVSHTVTAVDCGSSSYNQALFTMSSVLNGANDKALTNWFGDGSDGNVAILIGTTTLTRDMHYCTLKIAGTGAINTGGYKIFVSDTLDLSQAGAGAIQRNGVDITIAQQSGADYLTSGTVGGGQPVTEDGGTGSTAYPGGHPYSSVAGFTGNGGSGGIGGKTYYSNVTPVEPATAGVATKYQLNLFSSLGSIDGGSGFYYGGGAGSGGNGAYAVSTSSDAGDGGGGGAGGGVVVVVARNIIRGTSAGIIQAKGGRGANGGNTSATTACGGGGGGGGGGGFVCLIYTNLSGPSNSSAIDVTAGSGGSGGNGYNSLYKGGSGGCAGSSGGVYKFNIATGEISSNAPIAQTTVADTPTGTAGTAGITATTRRYAL